MARFLSPQRLVFSYSRDVIKIYFATNLKKLRKEKGMTQEDLSKELSVSRSTISSWERGNSYPDLNMLITISIFFDIYLDHLLKEDKEMVKAFQDKIKKGTIIDYWPVNLFLFLTTFFLVSYFANKFFGLPFNPIDELITGGFFWLFCKILFTVYKKKNGER
ncbi:helix-turn-helix domain-containing protein [Aerococcus urinaehominis]|uniref:helix-turn-helix domain-containing protein n=2 Tax=Aerococcus urinaehominis TaxID=128944 RepID=UPI0009E7F6AD|nr:helix-turn-helix transcriptional regulator [Aerococcus urinaehominis]